MVNAETVCAVVVTFNRKALLLECLEGLLKQTRPIDALYLIDNASSDETEKLLYEQGYIHELPPLGLDAPWVLPCQVKRQDGSLVALYYVRMHDNTGGSGGFHEGVKRAYEGGFQWLWLMDDDVRPVEDGLEKILHVADEGYRCVQPARVDLEGNPVKWERRYDPTRSRDYTRRGGSFRDGKTIESINVGCFEGMLIHRAIIEKIGFPDPRFFIAGDDVVYGYLASRVTQVVYANVVALVKLLPSKPISSFGLYYHLRNHLLQLRVMRELGEASWIAPFSVAALFIKALRRSIAKFFGKKKYQAYTLATIWSALTDGLKGAWGRRA
jgi:rhamnopyranosyl-N-acetylglucosaminyl-diphospho-decaprenol beta-1,3/1,4-galactofuranosyltransferase